MRLERIMRMGLAEIAGRTRQELWKGAERMRVRPQQPRLRGGAAALARTRHEIPKRFFAGTADGHTARLLEERLPDECRRLLAEAESILEGRFDLLGYRGLFFGDPIDWHLDPITGRRAPLTHWSRLDPLDAERNGDSKVIWELNRHQWMVRLAQAYQLTGDERYARHVSASVESWLAANPPGRGLNWASSLEAALRIIAWCWTLVLLCDSPMLSAELFCAMVESIGAQARHIERYLSYYFSPNTHLTGEALGLFYVGVLFPELGPARRWRELGRTILLRECARQVLADGVHFERTTCYQRYTAEIYLHFTLLGGFAAGDGEAAVCRQLEQLLEFLVTVCTPMGAMPEIGDADGGWLLPLTRRDPQDLRGLFAVAAARGGRSDFAWAARGLAPEVLWLLGRRGMITFDALRPAPPTAPLSRLFAKGGYAIMRSGWDERAHQLLFDVGPLGCPVSAGHGHADLLSIQCSAFGQPFLVDPGTYCYTASRSWRDFFRSTAAHSTVTVDGLDQAVPAGPFRWREHPRAVLTRWQAARGLEVTEAEHTAYRGLTDPVIHRRRVVWIARRYWVIVDDLFGAGAHRLEVRFQFAPVDVSLEQPWIRARGSREAGLLVRSFAALDLETRLVAGDEAPRQGWVSPGYGQRVAAPMIISAVSAHLPLRIATLLYPVAEAGASAPFTTVLNDAAGQPTGLMLDDGPEVVYFGDREALVSRAAARNGGPSC